MQKLSVFIVATASVLFLVSTVAEDLKLSRDSLVGVWTGTETNGLSCRLEFGTNALGRVHTFRKDRHLTTVNFHWGIDQTKTNVLLGLNGRAYSRPNGELQLELRPVNTTITTVRDVTLKKLESSGPKK